MKAKPEEIFFFQLREFVGRVTHEGLEWRESRAETLPPRAALARDLSLKLLAAAAPEGDRAASAPAEPVVRRLRDCSASSKSKRRVWFSSSRSFVRRSKVSTLVLSSKKKNPDSSYIEFIMSLIQNQSLERCDNLLDIPRSLIIGQCP